MISRRIERQLMPQPAFPTACDVGDGRFFAPMRWCINMIHRALPACKA
jgi:hypothetical protein